MKNSIKVLMFAMTLILCCLPYTFADTTLTSCGQNSGWVNGETYILNFTADIENTYAKAYCFVISDAANYDEITFKGVENQTIINKKADLKFFWIQTSGLGTSELFSFEDLNIEYTDTAEDTGEFLYVKKSNTLVTGTSYFKNSNFDNVEFKGGFNFINLDFQEASGNMYLMNSTMTDLFVVVDDTIFGYDTATSCTSYSYHRRYSEMDVSNSVLISVNADLNNPCNTTTTSDYFLNNVFENSVIKTRYYGGAHTNTLYPNNYTDCLITGQQFSHDSSYINNVDQVYKKTLFNYRFVDKVELSETDIEGGYSETAILLDGSNVGTPYTIQLQENLDTSLVPVNFTNFRGFDLSSSSSKISCEFDGFCFMSSPFSGTLSTKFRGLISLQSGASVSGLVFDKDGSNNAHVIANVLDLSYDGMYVYDNIFNKETGSYVLSSDNSNDIIKLKGNNINIYENIFDVIGTSTKYQYLFIESLSHTTNKVYNNTFENTITTPTGDSEIFSYACDTLFYNNYIETGTIVNNICTGDLNVTPLIGFEHTDGKVYYYNLGNYYEDNTACVDSDSDGFCDSSYTSGIEIDTNPLSSYPFEYTAHLLTYDTLVDDIDFNITLTGITDGANYTIANGDETLNIGFSQNSDFPDLICDYVIDGIGVSGETISPTIKDNDYNVSVNGWTEKSYSYRVECYNDITFKTSQELVFTIIFDAAVDPGDDVDDDDDSSDSETLGVIDGLFSGDSDQETQGIQSIFSNASRPIYTLMILGFIALFCGILFVLFALLIAIGGGGQK